ncbi:motile sperm domain-containing protein 2-like protein [Leptotrombidium deliense]|uniref:Motile sperm domain-containing protein 2-like protein n=1 Tax=Leptotrombidium deliense TaxID=299467 RepID=A0A443SEU9_9ACAR|nr:motile sperm domain-containing protein 2-like protein [Leptotrombidium deliense]
MCEDENLVRRQSLFTLNKDKIQRSINNIGSCIQKFSSELCGHQSQQSVDIDDRVNEVRDLLMKEFQSNTEKYDENDIALILQHSEYRYVERFLERQKYCVEECVKMIKDTLRWRKEEGLSNLTDYSFPELCYSIGFQYIYEFDCDHNSVVHIRFKFYHKYNQHFVNLMEKYFCYLAFKADQIGAQLNTGWILVADLTSVSVRQWDLQHFLWLLKIYTNYCPFGLRKVIIYNIAWFLKPILNAAYAVIPQHIKNIMYVVHADQLHSFIPKANLPKYLGGCSHIDHHRPPCDHSLPSIYAYMSAKYGMCFSEVRNVMKKYEKLIDDDDH